MNPMEIVEKIKATNPAVLEKMNEKVAAQVVRLALSEVRKQLVAADEGVVAVSGLGNFRVKLIEKDVDGAKVTTRRTLFAAAKPVDQAAIGARTAKRVESQSTD